MSISNHYEDREISQRRQHEPASPEDTLCGSRTHPGASPGHTDGPQRGAFIIHFTHFISDINIWFVLSKLI